MHIWVSYTAEITAPLQISVDYSAKYRDLYCTNKAMTDIVQEALTTKLATLTDFLPCVSNSTCQLSNRIVTDCVEPNTRKKRQTETAGFSITLTISPTICKYRCRLIFNRICTY